MSTSTFPPYRPSASVLFNELSDGESVLLDLDSEEYFGLNEVGSNVWEIITNGGDLDEFINELSTATSTSATVIRADVAALIHDLEAAGLIQTDEHE